MAMALRSSGKDILFAACNWGKYDPSGWMRSRGAHTYRSTGDIFDVPKSYKDIFKSQVENIEGSAPDCYNDMDMLITGMHGSGNVGLMDVRPAVSSAFCNVVIPWLSFDHGSRSSKN